MEELHVDESVVINIKGSVDDNVTQVSDKVLPNGKEINANNETVDGDESDGEISKILCAMCFQLYVS